MKALKFTLNGETAFFKDNTINSIYLTYGNLHRVALLGIFGAIMGYSGYNQQGNFFKNEKRKEKKDYPEFYEKLKNLKISIVSNGKYGTFDKKIQSFNNGVGYASKEEGGNLIVKQFWLEKPSWDIYLFNDSTFSNEVIQQILEKRAVYIPYLGSNDHFANITNINEIDLIEVNSSDEIVINSMINCDVETEIEIDEFSCFEDIPFKYIEYLPVALSLEMNQYIKNKILITNWHVFNLSSKVYCEANTNQNIIFY